MGIPPDSPAKFVRLQSWPKGTTDVISKGQSFMVSISFYMPAHFLLSETEHDDHNETQSSSSGPSLSLSPPPQEINEESSGNTAEVSGMVIEPDDSDIGMPATPSRNCETDEADRTRLSE